MTESTLSVFLAIVTAQSLSALPSSHASIACFSQLFAQLLLAAIAGDVRAVMVRLIKLYISSMSPLGKAHLLLCDFYATFKLLIHKFILWLSARR